MPCHAMPCHAMPSGAKAAGMCGWGSTPFPAVCTPACALAPPAGKPLPDSDSCYCYHHCPLPDMCGWGCHSCRAMPCLLARVRPACVDGGLPLSLPCAHLPAHLLHRQASHCLTVTHATALIPPLPPPRQSAHMWLSHLPLHPHHHHHYLHRQPLYVCYFALTSSAAVFCLPGRVAL